MSGSMRYVELLLVADHAEVGESHGSVRHRPANQSLTLLSLVHSSRSTAGTMNAPA